MLNKQKLFKALTRVADQLFIKNHQQEAHWKQVWHEACNEKMLLSKIQHKKYDMLLPYWQGGLQQSFFVQKQAHPYTVIATDGSQIYYDRHQGPPCYMLQTGQVILQYGTKQSSVFLESEPEVHVLQPNSEISQSYIDLQREEQELQAAVSLIQKAKEASSITPTVCMLDGSIIFWHMQGDAEDKQEYLEKYFTCFKKMYEEKVPWFGYISYPKSRELVNIMRLYAAGFDDAAAENVSLFDVDIAAWYLKEGFRTQWFENKSGISYVYPTYCKPYFCYVHVGYEIVRLEVPAWVAQDECMSTRVVQVALDQACKGKGYPVCLFEAHEQAVISGADREFFYSSLHMMAKNRHFLYQQSEKSRKKRQPLV